MTAFIASMREELHQRAAAIGRCIRIMEVCGTHTVSFFRSGIRSMLPRNLKLISGPGCPVCVTAQRHIDAAMDLAGRAAVTLATYGDMLRVPGRRGSLERLRAAGADIRVINSARTAVELAAAHHDRQIVLLGVGFETTAPATAAVILEAKRRKLFNFSVLMSHKRVVPAMQALLRAGDVPIDGFLCPGHVSVIIGSEAYREVVEQSGKPCVVAGFEPLQLIAGLVHIVRQIERRQARLENVYPAVVRRSGNRVALELMDRVFVAADAPWRELGVIHNSGFDLRPAFRRFDAQHRFNLTIGQDADHPACKCGEVIQGKFEPAQCPLFDHGCTPLTPIGPCMVSSEGTCAAWYRFGRLQRELDTVVSAP